MRKKRTALRKKKVEQSYGVLTDISRNLNAAFGDTTGRTISRRTAHGLKRSLNLHHIDNDSAELIVHSGLVATGALLKSKSETSQGIGILLGAALWGLYQEGKWNKS